MKFFYPSQAIDPYCEDFFTLDGIEKNFRVTVEVDKTVIVPLVGFVIVGTHSDGWTDVVVSSMDKDTIEAALSEVVGELSTIHRHPAFFAA